MNSIKGYGICIVAVFLVHFSAFTQTGKEFWFAVPYIDASHDSDGADGVQSGPNYFRISTGEAGAVVQFYYFPGGGASNKTLALTANVSSNSVASVQLVKSDPSDVDGVVDTLITLFSSNAVYNTVLDKGLYIKSNNPVSVYYEIGSYNNTDLFALKGKDALGVDFYPVFQNRMNNANEAWATDSWASIDIVSAEDGNTVTIEQATGVSEVITELFTKNYSANLSCAPWYVDPAKQEQIEEVTVDGVLQSSTVVSTTVFLSGAELACLSQYNAGATTLISSNASYQFSGSSTTSISLDQGETYAIRSTTRDAVKLIGSTHITSTGKIAVTGKDDSAMDNDGAAADVIGDQMIPVANAGSVYIVPDFNTGAQQEQFAFIRAIADNTTIYTGAGTVLSTLDAGDVYTFSSFNNDGASHKIYSDGNDFFCYHVSGFEGGGGNLTEFGGAILPPVDRCTGSTQSAFNIPQANGHEIAIISRSNTDFYYRASGDAGWTAFSPTFTAIAVGAETWYYSNTLNFAPATDGTNYLVKNTASTFHLCVMSSLVQGVSDGTFYGYFSDFTESDLQLGFDTLATGEVQLFAFGGKEGTYEWSLFNPTPASTSCADNYFAVVADCNKANPIVLSSDILDISLMYKYYATGENTCSSPATLENYVQFEVIDNSAFFVPLPVELFSLTAESVFGLQVDIQWTTASETDNAYFIVERASETSGFVAIDQIHGAGTSSETHTYQIADMVPRAGMYYYRLRQVDFHGTESISHAIAVAVNVLNADLLVYPTIIDSDSPLYIERSSGSTSNHVQLAIYTSAGRLLSSGTYTGVQKQFTFDMNVPNGTYQVAVDNGIHRSVSTVVVAR